nr:retrovirus-related Pol polyprotein from transposon TNT 1-94 [Tanacetum cinerariifolium]
MKAKIALLEASSSSPQNPKTFQPKNKGLIAKIFDWDKEEVTQVKVLMALADDELTIGKNHAHNGECVYITMRKVNTFLSMDEDVDWQIYLRELLQAQRILYYMICKREDHRSSDHEMYIASFKRSENYKAQPYQYASTSKQILKAKAKPFPPCTHYGFNDHRLDDCRNYPECEICRSYDHFTS